jgi:hypothetical protein
MAIRWIRNVIIDGEKSTIEVQIGDTRIGDKCYTRVNSETERWFQNSSPVRDEIIAEGVDILRRRLASKNVTLPDGRPYDWQ